MGGSNNESLRRLQELHRDLVNLSTSVLYNVDRLVLELESNLDRFRSLLDKQSKDDKSRQTLSAGTIDIDNVEYTVNEDFKQDAIQISDALSLNELDAAKLLLSAQDDSQTLDRSPLLSAIIIFHEERQFVLESLRLILQQAAEEDGNEDITSVLQNVVGLILQQKDGRPASGSAFWRRCLTHMSEIETWLQQISDRVQSVSLVGHAQAMEFSEAMEFQRSSLTRQHESLAAISCLLTKANHTQPDDFRFVLSRVRSLDKYDATLLHYLPVLTGCITHFGSSENTCSLQDAKSLHQTITSSKDNETWSLRNFHAAAVALWLAEFCGRFVDQASSPVEGGNADAESESRSSLFMEALRDGAFHFLLSVCEALRNNDQVEPTRKALNDLLLQDAPSVQLDSIPLAPWFRDLLMEQFQMFADSYISNMPDTLRKLKVEEDEQRRQMQGRVQLEPQEFELHLERFFVIVSHAFEGFDEASKAFWMDPEGNLFGFLQWASQRQSTPRMAAFCELLRSISGGEECSGFAHKFLLDEGVPVSAKLRRSSPLNWTIIFNELEFYSSTIKDRPAAQQKDPYSMTKPRPDQPVEPESAILLECYLRLLAHLCREGPETRFWILTHATFNLPEHLLSLCSTSVESRLRACAFIVLSSLLTKKEREISDGMWTTLDSWIQGGAVMGSNTIRAPQQASIGMAEQVVFEMLATGFDEPNAFVSLLVSLVAPSITESTLHDTLPFPESLGSSYRMPGIDSYVDFAIGRVFSRKPIELQDSTQIQVIKVGCLNFIALCLLSFNDSLLLLANKSNVSIDSAMQTSSLSTYLRIHPFARVMEWMFNEKVIGSLFASLSQNIQDINSAPSNSDLVTGILRTVEVIDMVMNLQSTYFDIVRPKVKLESTNRRPAVANSALASFEDAILNHLDLVPVIGLYCGSGHQDLAIASLRLIQRLSMSRKLAGPVALGGGRSDKSRLITALEKNNDAESISRTLILQMQFDEREFEQGADSPGFVVKTEILKFLNTGITSIPDKPTLTHLLLGFTCSSRELDYSPDGLFASEASLFHSVVRFTLSCPSGDEQSVISWLVTMKDDGIQLLRRLWKTPISSSLVLGELRRMEYGFLQAGQLIPLNSETLWNGKSIFDVDFFVTDAPIAYTRSLRQRTAYLELMASELRLAAQAGMKTLQSRIRSTLLGSTTLSDGQQFGNLTIFDLLDFLDLEIGEQIPLPESRFFKPADYDICKDPLSDGSSRYDMRSVAELIMLQDRVVRSGTQLANAGDEQQIQADQQNLYLCILANNQRQDVLTAHGECLHAWAHLVSVMLVDCNFDSAMKRTFVLQVLQLIIPRLENSFSDDMSTSLVLAQLGQALLQHFDFPSELDTTTPAGEAANDRLFALFRANLSGIQNSQSDGPLREVCYKSCQSYLRGVFNQQKNSSLLSTVLQSLKATNDRLAEILCDDAYASEGSCKVSAILLLDAIIMFGNTETPNYIIECFNRINFISVTVDNLKTIALEIQSASGAEVLQIVSYYAASLSLLLRLSQTRAGAAQVMNAGFFSAIRESGLLSADPDIGLDIDNPSALTRYLELVLSVLRVVNAIVLSRGSENSQTISQARGFLHEYRPTIVGIFKRSARIGRGTSVENDSVSRDLVDQFTMLISMCGFLDTQEEKGKLNSSPRLFT